MSRRSADAWMGCPWPSSSRPPRSVSSRPDAILARRSAHAPFVLAGVTIYRAAPDAARPRSAGVSIFWPRPSGGFSCAVAFSAEAFGRRPSRRSTTRLEQLLDPLGALARLADKNLLQVVDPAGDEPRFRMLETIRAFALPRH